MKEINNFIRTRTSMAVLLALSPAGLQMAHAGAGFGDNVDSTGKQIKVSTYYANSPSGLRPAIDCFDATGKAVNPTTGGICDSGAALHKFVDTLPGLGAAAANKLGQYIPVAVPDITSYPGSDYYEIAVVDYAEKMHSDLAKATHLRGYVQLSTTNVPGQKLPLVQADGTAVNLPNGTQATGVDKAHYLGPLISATKGRAVRIKYYNLLPTGTKGNLFIPVDHTLTEAGIIPGDKSKYTENRAAIHWHGGDTPWVSDGMPHQWIAPVGEGLLDTVTGTYINKGISAVPVPDMPNPGDGAQTLYFPNNMSGRFMFYHDHTAGLTRLNVYAGIAAGYLLSDPTEAAMVAGGQPIDPATGLAIPGSPTFTAGTLPADQIPLVIQDKTFVPKDIAQQDAAWNKDINGAAVNVWGQEGDLWFPHVYETNQDPSSFDGTNPVGRWDWGPWFWPVFPSSFSLPSGSVGDASSTPEAFMDTPIVNGTAYPTTTVEPKAYRFRILNAANDRFINLGLYIADSAVSTVAVSNGGTGYSATPMVTINDATGTGATATATVVAGVITGITVTNSGTGYSATPTVTITDSNGTATGATAIATVAVNTEVQMVPFDTTQAAITPFPTSGGLQDTGWGTPDSMMHLGGVPNPSKLGPDIIQIGTEGGFIPHAVTIPSTPINYEYNKRSITVLNVLEHGVWMGPAERVDAVIDFSQYAGKTLILYNDAPAPLPAGDPRIDYYTGAPDQSGAGGAESTLAGYGPNTRTIMQIKVSGTGNGTAFNVDQLKAAMPKAYAVEQARPAVPEVAYNDAFGTNDADNLFKISTGSIAQPTMDLTPTGPMTLTSIHLVGGGTGYIKAPTVAIVGGGGTGAKATATINATTRMITGFILTNPGTGYTSLPTVQITPVQGGIGATANAVSNTTKNLPVQNKGIQELFDPVYGRMNATFAVELPFTSAINQTTIPLAYIDPATEVLADGETQIWKITHNGVDSHPVHFHLVNVQVINRVGWDGTLKPPYDNEFGWKETLRMNPLEDVYVAVTAKKPQTNGFGLPQSVRLRDPSQPLGGTLGFTQIDPVTGNPASIVNTIDNYNNEYVWHCHILGHEENDFMRPVVFQPGGASQVGAVRTELALAAPAAPTLTATAGVLNWVDNSDNEIRFDIQQAPITYSGGTTTVGAFNTIGTAQANAGNPNWVSPVPGVGKNAGTFTPPNTTVDYAYRVAAVGAAATTVPIATLADVANTFVSAYSTPVTVVGLPAAPTGLGAVVSTTVKSIALSWTNAATNATGYQVLRNGTVIAPLAATATSYADTDTALTAGTTYTYTVQAVNSSGNSNPATVTATPVVPAAPGSFVATPTANSVALTWAASTGASSYTVLRTVPTAATVATVLATAPLTATNTGLTAATSYTYTVTSTDAWGSSNASTVSVTTAATATAPPTAPVAPTGVSIQRTSATAATLAWTDASNNETRFQVQISTNGGATWANLGTAVTRTAAQSTATGDALTSAITVANSTNASYRVNTSNSVGVTSSLAVSLNDTVAPATAVLAAPTKAPNVSGSPVGTIVTLNWTDNANNNATYTLQRSINNGTTWSNVSTIPLAGNATATTQTILGSNAATNLYRIRAVNSVSTVNSNTVTIVTP